MAPTKTTHTLFFYLALLVAFASLVDASSQPQMNHKRLVKKRSLLGLSGPAGTDSSSPPPGSGSSSSSSVDSTSSDSVATPLIIGRPPPVSTSTSSSSSSSTTSTSSSSTSTSTSSTSTSLSSSSPSSTSTSSSTSSTSTLTSSTSDDLSTFTSTAILTGTSASSSPMPHADDSSGSGSKKTTTTIIIVIAASVGGIAILWTLFRKWKLARSSRFDDRLQPIDWQPPAAGETRRQPTSAGSATHPTAQGAHGSEHGHGSSDFGHGGRLTPLSDHDFTPLPSNHLAAVGTYADLARGPSPQPPMYEAYSGQAPIVTRPTYDVSVPLHHQAGYGGHDAYEYTHYNNAPRGY